MKTVITPATTVTIKDDDGMEYSSTGSDEFHARLQLATQLHTMAQRAFNDFSKFHKLANSLDA